MSGFFAILALLLSKCRAGIRSGRVSYVVARDDFSGFSCVGTYFAVHIDFGRCNFGIDFCAVIHCYRVEGFLLRLYEDGLKAYDSYYNMFNTS